MNWRQFPILRVGLCFIAGVALGKFVYMDPTWTLCIAAILLGSIFYIDSKDGLSDRTTVAISCVLLLASLLLGVARVHLQSAEADRSHYSHFMTGDDTVVGTVMADLKKKTSVKTHINVEYINGTRSRGKLLVYFPSGDTVSHISPGDIISMRSAVLPTRANTNPLAFDYKAYLKNRGIDYQVYLRYGQYRLEQKADMPFIYQVTYDLRNRALAILEKRLTTTEQLATASAMILGYRDHISEELYNAYASTGSVHVLAVSGLHVGIICWIFIALFRKIKDQRMAVKAAKAIFLILLVWFYAILTGAAPAVVRASVMFTIMIVGKYWFDEQNIYNTLAFSAVLLLMYDPLLLFQASFQFSYLALLGIIYFHKLWYPLFDTQYLWLDKLWNLLVVAGAAQSLVFPVTIYYFHKFPLYFLVSGVVSVALAFAILINGVLLIAFSSVPVMGDVLGYTLRFELDFFINIVYWIRDLPYSNITGLWFSSFSTIMIYVGLLLFMIYQYHKKAKVVTWGISLIAIVLVLNNISFHQKTAVQSELAVYEVSGGSLVDVFDGTEVYTYKTAGLTQSTELFAADNFRVSKRAEHRYTIQEGSRIAGKPVTQGVLQYKDLLVYIPAMVPDSMLVPVDIDLLVVSGECNLGVEILELCQPSAVVLTKDVKWRDRKKWLGEAETLAIFVHDIRDQGAFLVSRDLPETIGKR